MPVLSEITAYNKSVIYSCLSRIWLIQKLIGATYLQYVIQLHLWCLRSLRLSIHHLYSLLRFSCTLVHHQLRIDPCVTPNVASNTSDLNRRHSTYLCNLRIRYELKKYKNRSDSPKVAYFRSRYCANLNIFISIIIELSPVDKIVTVYISSYTKNRLCMAISMTFEVI